MVRSLNTRNARDSAQPEKRGSHQEMDKSLKRIVIGAFIVQAIVAYLLLHYGV